MEKFIPTMFIIIIVMIDHKFCYKFSSFSLLFCCYAAYVSFSLNFYQHLKLGSDIPIIITCKYY